MAAAKGKRRRNRRSRSNSEKRAGKRANRVKKFVAKKAVALSGVKLKEHSMLGSSAVALFWLAMLSMVVLNMLAAISIGILLIGLASDSVVVIIAAIGMLFGYVTLKLVTLIESLEARHHFFAAAFIPAVAFVNLFVVSISANSLARLIGLAAFHNPFLVSFSYAIAFAAPFLARLARFGLRSFGAVGR